MSCVHVCLRRNRRCGNISVASGLFRGWALSQNLSLSTVGCGTRSWVDCFNQISQIEPLSKLSGLDPEHIELFWSRDAHRDLIPVNLRCVIDWQVEPKALLPLHENGA